MDVPTVTQSSADANDALYAASKQHPLICIAPSTVCDGLGLFAVADIPANACLTAYAGRHCLRDHDVIDDEGTTGRYKYKCTDGTIIDAEQPAQCDVLQHGIAHLANDAIHETVTGRSNNCLLVERQCAQLAHYGLPSRINHLGHIIKTFTRVYLITTTPVAQGEELLTPYCIGYWLTRDPATYPPGLQHFLHCHNRVQSMLQQQFSCATLTISDFIDYVPPPRLITPPMGEDMSEATLDQNDDNGNIKTISMHYEICGLDDTHISDLPGSACTCTSTGEDAGEDRMRTWIVQFIINTENEDEENDAPCALRVFCACCDEWIVSRHAQDLSHDFKHLDI
jgi:hypothetical protein